MSVIEPATDDIGSSLALAVVASSSAPVLLLNGGLTVIAASQSFATAFNLPAYAIAGRKLTEMGQGEWRLPQLATLLTATAAGEARIEAYEMDLSRPGTPTRRLVINAQKLEYGDPGQVRLLVAVADVTDARLAEKLKDDLVREKGVLLQELQHRVANSLQIIASVLLQSARRVQSDETRTHLHAAHHRLMSVATVQKQLAVSNSDDVDLRQYLEKLCASLGDSMIHDPALLRLEVVADDSKSKADVSVSLGLIVTELVINALKHAFPEECRGKITVGYHSDGPSWAMSVSDDGVGMAAASPDARAGLGTSIVAALAKQLRAQIKVTDNDPGTRVSITHDETKAPEAVDAV